MRVFGQPAYVLLNRPYSETSWLVEVFTRDYGRVGLMAKGARRLKSKLKGVLQPFQPVILSWTGKGEVPTLTSAEVDQSEFNLFRDQLRGDRLVCGFYCNELLVSLLHRHDPHQSLFTCYHETMLALNSMGGDADTARLGLTLAEILRGFEQAIMKETGYEISFLTEADGKTMIEDHALYQFQPSEGFIRVNGPHSRAINGRVIKSLHGAGIPMPSNTMLGDEPFDDELPSQAKRLMREILSQTLGYKKIVSRDLFFPVTHMNK